MMPNRTAAPLPRAVLAAAALFVPLAALAGGGCKGEQKAGPATAPSAAAAVTQTTFNGVTFEHPADWKVNVLPDNKGVNVTAPEDAGWEPNVFVEVQPSPDGKAVDELLSANVALLGARKQDFQVRNQSTADHPKGFKFGRVEYTNSSEGSPSVPLTQWSIVAPIPGKQQRLQVQAAAATAAWDKYRPQFERVVESITLPK